MHESVYVSRSHASLHFSGYFSVPHSRKEMYDFVCKWKEMLPLFYCLYINLKTIILAISLFQRTMRVFLKDQHVL